MCQSGIYGCALWSKLQQMLNGSSISGSQSKSEESGLHNHVRAGLRVIGAELPR